MISFFSIRPVFLCLFFLVVNLVLFVESSFSVDQMPVSTRALSMGNAVTAYPMGPMSIHYNPACLSTSKKKEFTVGATALLNIKIKSEVETSPAYEGNLIILRPDPLDHSSGTTTDGAMKYPVFGSSDYMVAPNLGVSKRKPGSNWTFGFGMYSPHFMGFMRDDDDDPGRYGGKRVYNQRFVYAAPSLACQVTDTFSIGFSVALGQTYRGMKTEFRSSTEIVAITEALGEATEGAEIPVLSELTLPQPWFNGGLLTYETMAELKMDLKDDLDTSYNIGMLWEPFSWVSLGLCYRSEAKSEPSGEYSFKYSPQFQNYVDWFGESPVTVSLGSILGQPYQGVPEQRGTVTMKSSKNPQNAQFGIMLKPVNWLKMMCDATWTNWSSINSEVYTFDQDIHLFKVLAVTGYSEGTRTYTIKRDLKDIWNIGFGFEITPFDWVSIRAGYQEKDSYVKDKYFDMSLPVQDMKIYSAGLGIKLDSRWSIDLAGIYMESDTYRNNYTAGNSINSNEFFDTLHNPFVGMDYKQKSRASLMSISFNYIW